MDKNLFQIVKNYGYKSLSIIFTLLLVNSILELMVIGSIIPFAAVMVDPENIKNITGFTGEVYFNSRYKDGTPRKLLNCEKIHKLGWKHKIDLQKGLKLTYQWYIDNVK